MKITAGKAGAGSPHRVRVQVWMTEEEAKLFPIGLAHLSDNMHACIKEHLGNGHNATRHTKEVRKP